MKKLIFHLFCIGLILGGSPCVLANQFCFTSAKTYYEQVYCELEAKGKLKGLPSFEQFKRNNEVVQASLLKIPAERNRIALPLPKKSALQIIEASTAEKNTITQKELKHESKPDSNQRVAQKEGSVARKFDRLVSGDAEACQLQAGEIHCAFKRYRLIGNRINSRLAKGALLESNKMLLPLHQPGQSLNAYVTLAYRQYIEKMCEIGLGAVTMAYARFAYLYEDLQSKNVNFVQRFELMYTYLKKDKATMWVSEKIPVNAQLAMQYCELMTENLYVCAAQGQNYIFELAR
jgi:hypothetical protein